MPCETDAPAQDEEGLMSEAAARPQDDDEGLMSEATAPPKDDDEGLMSKDDLGFELLSVSP